MIIETIPDSHFLRVSEHRNYSANAKYSGKKEFQYSRYGTMKMVRAADLNKELTSLVQKEFDRMIIDQIRQSTLLSKPTLLSKSTLLSKPTLISQPTFLS
jgi:hypothetical protein